MGIEVAREPTSTGSFRYEAFGAGRRTHGFRGNKDKAAEAARADEAMLYEAGRCAGSQSTDEGEQTVQKRPLRRRDHRPGD